MQINLNQILDVTFDSCAGCGYEWLMNDHIFMIIQVFAGKELTFF